MTAATLVQPVLKAPSVRRVLLVVGAVGAAAAVATSAALGATASTDSPVLVALVRGLLPGAPIAVGLWLVEQGAHARFGALLASSGAIWFLTTLAESGDAVLYTIGRAAGWSAWVLLTYVALAFPLGRLTTRTDRMLVWGLGLSAVALFAPQLLLAERFVIPTPFASCTADCPANAFFVLKAEPAVVGSVLQPLSGLLVFVLAAATAVRLFERRASSASARMLSALTPVAGVVAVYALLRGMILVFRDGAGSGGFVDVLVWSLALCMPAISLAFLIGVVRSQLVAGHALEQLAHRIRETPDTRSLKRALADALGDRSVRIAFPPTGPGERWTDSTGRAVEPPHDGAVEVRCDGRVAAAIVHDPLLRVDAEFVTAACAIASVVLENHRLTAETRTAMHDMRRSRARIAASALQERRRIERDLHDGAQQRLVALRIELGLAEQLVGSDPAGAVARLRELENEVDGALDEMRSLAHGVYPATLADRGVEEALRAAVRRSPIPVLVEAHDVGRYPTGTESAVYFCVTEALQNAFKHAAGARRIVIRLDGDEQVLRFSVGDDGAGATGGVVRAGHGITNMHDRLASIGGEVAIVTTPHLGTVVRGWAPTRVPAID